MSKQSLEARIATLEREVAALKAEKTSGEKRDWRRTIGMFTDDPGMLEIFDEAMKLREVDRVRARKPRRSKARS